MTDGSPYTDVHLTSKELGALETLLAVCNKGTWKRVSLGHYSLRPP